MRDMLIARPLHALIDFARTENSPLGLQAEVMVRDMNQDSGYLVPEYLSAH